MDHLLYAAKSTGFFDTVYVHIYQEENFHSYK